MKTMSEKDYKVFEKLVSLRQGELKKVMNQYLRNKYTNVISTRDYIVAVGDIPIALVAHMDTVFKSPVSNLYYDERKGTLWSSEGLGADDRAGIFAIIKILQEGFRPSIILTTDEEKGGLGAAELASKPCPIPGLKYMIQLDRRGTNDCVFYDCYSPDFVEYVESFGFCEQWGSFSDISFLMPAWKICGVNLSVGYEDEHSIAETLKIKPLYNTIKKVCKMLAEDNIPLFDYSELYMGKYGNYGWTTDIYGQHCSYCKKLFSEYDLFPVKSATGVYKYSCPDCLVGMVEWCEMCQNPYEIVDEKEYEGRKLCPDCAEALCLKK